MNNGAETAPEITYAVIKPANADGFMINERAMEQTNNNSPRSERGYNSELAKKPTKNESSFAPPLPDEPVPKLEQSQANQSETELLKNGTGIVLPVPKMNGRMNSPSFSEESTLNNADLSAPPLPDEPIPQTEAETQPPLPDEPVPVSESTEKPRMAWSADGQVAAIWDDATEAYYFWDKRTNTTSWENPLDEKQEEDQEDYTSVVRLSKLTGKFIRPEATPETQSEPQKAYKHMEQFFDVKGHLQEHNGKSLLEERRNKRYTRKEMAELKRKAKERKERKRRALFDISSDDIDFRRRKIIRY
ncbi:fungal protein [Schizosaccharomyces japonicus yFS275]|uniref:Fungal protein n=1 Tax=Schizosaccharomyces japonicus (strain yFS275 / FY16936) TaxID=402676 RepID=B6K5J3_SCHJY|nr:fungal protein [Schizosaccharomyces japonicus yFS275]EEB08797.1 fungal protein [Schizosaccharomyces japonicus yFS275]